MSTRNLITRKCKEDDCQNMIAQTDIGHFTNKIMGKGATT